MTPPRHDKTPLPKSLTDSQRELVAVTVEETLHQQSSEEIEMARATPKPSETTDMAAEALRWRNCEERGPAEKLWRKVESMEKTMGQLKEEQTKLLAVLGFWKWALPVVAAAVGAFASIVGTAVRLRHGG